MYEQIAQEYRRLVRDPNSPLCRAEAYTFQQRIGPLDGLRVLDLGCGEGFYTRQLQQRGAAAVVGVDQSPSMIALAREAEAKQPSGIQYHLADVCTLEPLGQFDLVVSFFMLNHARSYTELAAMCRGIAAHLKEGGRFSASTTTWNCPPQPTRSFNSTDEPTAHPTRCVKGTRSQCHTGTQQAVALSTTI